MTPITAFTEKEITDLRSATKGASKVIHFNNAGSSLPPDVVVDTVISYLQEEAIYGGYETEFKYQQQLDNTYKNIAKLINAAEDEIAVVENASVAWGIAFNGISFKPGDEIITSEMEYVTNLIGFLNAKNNYGIVLKVVPNDENGVFSIPKLAAAISPKTKLIAVTHIPSTAGGMIPIVEIGKIARKYNILYLVDACQSAGQIPIDVQEIGCDMLSVTGRKYLRAPRGTGFLYVKRAVQDQLRSLFVDGFSAPSVTMDDYKLRNDARRFELYEYNRALKLGLSKSVEYALDIGVDRIWLRVQHLANSLRALLSTIDGISVHDTGTEKCGIVTFTIKDLDSFKVKDLLAEKNINVSIGKAISTLIYMDKHQLQNVVRASLHYYNTEDEIEVFCDAIIKIIGR